MTEVLVLGAASWNRMVQLETLPQGRSATIFEAVEYEAAGSTGTGKAMALAGLGCRAVLHCALGRDEHGAKVRAACTARGIRLIVDEQDAPTPHHLNIMDRQGGRYSIFLSNGAPDPVIDMTRIGAEISRARTIFLSLCHSSKKILPLLNRVPGQILLDLHDYDGSNPWYEDFIACADIIQLSDVALPADPIPVVKRLLRGRARQVVLTRGEDGAEIWTGAARIKVPPIPAVLRDSNGAGDAFSVALWLAQDQGMALPEAGRFAAAAAAITVESDSLFPPGGGLEQIRMRAGLI
ncbi:MAG: carbohydrate kinase family protein [Paracoccus sp. (in: a-proteobacteria)]